MASILNTKCNTAVSNRSDWIINIASSLQHNAYKINNKYITSTVSITKQTCNKITQA